MRSLGDWTDVFYEKGWDSDRVVCSWGGGWEPHLLPHWSRWQRLLQRIR